MSLQVQTIEQELMVLKQQNEILTLRAELAKTQAEKSSKLEDSIYSPALYPHYKMVAKDMSDSSMVPKNYIGKPNDIIVAIAMGYQLGFAIEQALQHIAVINGRPCLWGDGMLALIIGRKDCIDIIEEPILKDNVIYGYKCTVKRAGKSEHSKSFTLDDAKKGGLLGKQGPWTTSTSRMLQLRARAFALRDRFADVLSGISMAEEVMDYIEGEIIPNAQSQATLTQTEKVKQSFKTRTGQTYETSKDDNATSADMDIDMATGEIKGEATQTNDIAPMESAGKQAAASNNQDSGPKKASPEQITKIESLMFFSDFSPVRLRKALNHYGVAIIQELSEEKAADFISILEKEEEKKEEA